MNFASDVSAALSKTRNHVEKVVKGKRNPRRKGEKVVWLSAMLILPMC